MKRWAIVAAVVLAVVGLSVFAAQRAGEDSAGRAPASEAEQAGQIVTDAFATSSDRAPAVGEFASQYSQGSVEPVGQPGDEPVAPPLPELAGRKIIRNASLELGVEDVGAAVQEVENIAAGAGGFVASSSIFIEHKEPPQPLPEEGELQPPSEDRRRTQTATVTIRVPASSYATVVSQLRGIAEEVEAETSGATDVSEEFADLEARQRNLEATEARYLELLSRAETIPDILTLQDRINAIRLEIERIQGRINLLNDLTDLATIEVHLRPFVPAQPPQEPGQEQGWAQEAADNAWETSLAVMRALGTGAIVGGVVLAWVAVPLLVGLVSWRLLGPRRPQGGAT